MKSCASAPIEAFAKRLRSTINGIIEKLVVFGSTKRPVSEYATRGPELDEGCELKNGIAGALRRFDELLVEIAHHP
jgi:hypothetical protein